jgi:hypothetical protein
VHPYTHTLTYSIYLQLQKAIIQEVVTVSDEETIKYYDAMLQEHSQRVEDGVPPTAEYKRLSDFVDSITKQLEEQGLTEDDEGRISYPKEVGDFLEAFDRARARRFPVM